MFSDLTTMLLPEDMLHSCMTWKEEGMRAPSGSIMVVAQTKDEHLLNQWRDYRAEDRERKVSWT